MQTFQDTTIVHKILNDPDDEINISVKNGCYSINRIVVPLKVIVQILPTLSNTATPDNTTTNIAVQLQAMNGTYGNVPAAPFRLISNINPSTFVLDFNKIAKVAPYVVRPYASTSTDYFAKIKFSGNQLTNMRGMSIKTTYIWRVMAQDAIVSGPV